MPSPRNITSDFLTHLFAEYRKQRVEYCLLRNYKSIPDRIESSDVDILISPSFKRKNRTIIFKLAKKYGAIIYNYYVDERFEQFFLSKRISPGDLFELKVDFFFDAEIYGVRLISGKEILDSKVSYKNFYIANDIFRVLDKWLFVHLLGSPLPLKYHAEFKRIFIRNRKSLDSILSKLLGNKTGTVLCSLICSKGFSNLPRMNKGALLTILFRVALYSPFFHLRHLPLFFFYRLKHFIFPKGEFVSVSGPDGSGKSTVLESTKKPLERLFRSRSGNHGHFRPNWLPRIANVAKTAGVLSKVDEAYASPHRGKPSGFLGSLFRFSYYLTDYIFGYFLKIRPALVRRELVLYDRYYFDMVADQGRSRILLPLWIRKMALWFIPLPNTAFFIHAPSAIIRKRKKELSLEKIEQLNAYYLKMAETSTLTTLENDTAVDIAASKLVDTVIYRRRKRLKLDRLYQ